MLSNSNSSYQSQRDANPRNRAKRFADADMMNNCTLTSVCKKIVCLPCTHCRPTTFRYMYAVRGTVSTLRHDHCAMHTCKILFVRAADFSWLLVVTRTRFDHVVNLSIQWDFCRKRPFRYLRVECQWMYPYRARSVARTTKGVVTRYSSITSYTDGFSGV